MQEIVYQHEIRINAEQIEQSFSLNQLWEAVVHVTKHPDLAVKEISECNIEETRSADGRDLVLRKINFGNYTVEEKIEFFPPQRIIHTIIPTDKFPESGLTVELEQPEDQLFALRFVYTEKEGESLHKGLPEIEKIRQAAWAHRDDAFVNEVIKVLTAPMTIRN